MEKITKPFRKNRLKHERQKRGWSREYVANEIGASAYSVGQWERGRVFPYPETVHNLCELFGMNAESLGLVKEDAADNKDTQIVSEQSRLRTETPTTSLLQHLPGGRYLLHAVIVIFLIVGVLFLLLYTLILPAFTNSKKQPLSQSNMTTCPTSNKGVTLYVDPNYRGHCHTFAPGDYDLAEFGLDQNVSSLKDANGAYHITLIDRTNRPGYFDSDTPQLPADWNDQAHSLRVEKHRPTSCHPGADGIIAFINTNYSGGCLFITGNIADLTPLNFDSDIVSIQFVGSYQNTRQLVIYKQPGYKDECGAYWQNQSDLLHCARLALSVQLLPFTPPTPIPTVPGTHYAGNVAPQAILSPGSAHAVVDENLHTEWVGGHMVELDLRWAFPVTIHRVVVWDRRQSPSDNNQMNKLKLSFSDGTSTGSIDMISQGPRCADVTFPEKTVTWLHLIAVDASGNNGYSEIEVWATTGPQYSNNTCVNHLTLTQ